MKIIGHRGARGLAPENTLASLKKALEHHVDMLEFDLRVTKDQVVILHHDASLRDPSGRKLPINHYTYEELRQHKPDLATFREVLEQINKTIPLYIEVKPKVLIAPIVELLESALQHGRATETLYLASRSQDVLRALHEALPTLPTIVIESWSGVRAHLRAREVGAQIVAMNERFLWWGFIRGFKHNSVKLYTYSLNNPRKAKRWRRWGLGGVVTDYPDRFEK